MFCPNRSHAFEDPPLWTGAVAFAACEQLPAALPRAMTPAVAEAVLQALGAYLGVGLAFGLMFVFFAIQRLDPAAQAVPVAARWLLLPGAAALWPVLAWKWLRRQAPPVA